MRYLLFILALLVLQGCPTEPPEPVPQAIEEVEFILDNQKIIPNHIFTKQEIRMRWLQIFAHPSEGWKRIPALAHIDQDLDWAERWEGNINEQTYSVALSEFLGSSMFSQIPDDELEDGRKWYDAYPWGTLDIYAFNIIRMDITEDRLDSIRQKDILFDGFEILEHKSRRWRLPLKKLDDSLGIGNITLRQLNNRVDVPQKWKDYVQANILSLPGINLDTDLRALFLDSRIDKRIFKKILQIKQEWLEHIDPVALNPNYISKRVQFGGGARKVIDPNGNVEFQQLPDVIHTVWIDSTNEVVRNIPELMQHLRIPENEVAFSVKSINGYLYFN